MDLIYCKKNPDNTKRDNKEINVRKLQKNYILQKESFSHQNTKMLSNKHNILYCVM